jgi:aspartate-semialdehyde dehydrogenase
MSKLAIAGATGNLGRETLRLMGEVPLPGAPVPVLLASVLSEGEEVDVMGQPVPVAPLKEHDFNETVAFFATPAPLSEQYIPGALAAGLRVVDASTAFLGEADVPVIAPHVNDDVLNDLPRGLVTLADVPAQQLAFVLQALQPLGLVKRLTTTILMPVSSHGKAGTDELQAQSIALLGGQGEVVPENFATQVAFNCLPQAGTLLANGHSTVEQNLAVQLAKIFKGGPAVSATAVTVPTFIGVAQAVSLTFQHQVETADARNILDKTEGIVLLDDPSKNAYSTPFGAAETEGIYVSRLRRDMLDERTLHCWIVSDNLRQAAREALTVLGHLLA